MSWLPTVAFIVVFAIGYFVYMQFKRASNAKKVIGHLVCDFTTDIGTSYLKLLPIIGRVAHDKKQIGSETVEFDYMVDEIACYETNYPEGKNRLEQVNARKAYYQENNPEPRIKRNATTLMSSRVINALRNEKATEVAMQTSKDLKTDQDFIKKNMISPMFVYIMLFVIILGIGAAIAITYQQGQSINLLKAAIGVK
jgi:hypothetical protein